MLVDEGDHHFGRRSSSACAKNADALRRISLARFSSTTLALQLLSIAGAFVGGQAGALAGIALGLAHPPPERLGRAAQLRCDRRNRRPLRAVLGACAPAPVRTTRSRTSGEYLLGRAMGPSSQRMGPPTIPARFSW